MSYLLNVRKDSIDPRDHITAPAIAHAPSISLRMHVPYVKDQGPLGSCTAHAGTEMLEVLFRLHASNLPLSIDRSTLRFSPLFQYAQERMMEGTFDQDYGAESRTIFRVLAKTGCCLEDESPYDPTRLLAAPSAEQIADASRYRIGAYHRVPDVGTAKTVLLSGYTFTVGTPLYSQFEGDQAAETGMIALPAGTSIGGHEMHVIGFDDEKVVLGQRGAFEVQNSWGPGWGDGGFCWIPYSYFAVAAGQWDFWTAHFGHPWTPKNGVKSRATA